MARPIIIKDRITGEECYPHTLASLVQTKDGGNVEDALDAASRRLFDDLWLAACRDFGSIDHTHTENGKAAPYCLNELWLTYEEAKEIYNNPLRYPNPHWIGSKCRTNLIYSGTDAEYDADPINANYLFADCSSLEVLRISVNNNYGFSPSSIANTFLRCRKLRKIIGIIDLGRIKNGNFGIVFSQCEKLVDVQIKGLRVSLSFENGATALSLFSFRYLIDKAANTSAITITVHPDVYAKLTGDTSNDAYNNLTDEEKAQWTALLPLAAAKNITFATT